MRSTLPVGILGYGAYVPRMRVRTEEISDAWRAKGSAAPAVVEKSVASFDEDVVTMAVEAARQAGLAATLHIQGGLDAWKKANGPLTR